MQEIFENVSNETKEIAGIAWRLAMAQKSPAAAAEFLDNVTNYYKAILTEEEVEFLRFYFHMQMEMRNE